MEKGGVDSSNPFTIVDGNWSNTTNAGTFYVNANYSTSNTNSNHGTHLMSRSPRTTCQRRPAPRQNKRMRTSALVGETRRLCARDMTGDR